MVLINYKHNLSHLLKQYFTISFPNVANEFNAQLEATEFNPLLLMDEQAGSSQVSVDKILVMAVL